MEALGSDNWLIGEQREEEGGVKDAIQVSELCQWVAHDATWREAIE